MKTWLTHGCLAAASLTLVLGCSSNNEEERSFTDTTGAVFVRKCEGDSCDLYPEQAGCGSGATMIGSRWLLVCSEHGRVVWDDNCRPVVCESAADCQFFRGGTGYECVEGLCENPDWDGTWSSSAVTAYCLRDVSRAEYCKDDGGDSVPSPQGDGIARERDLRSWTCSKLPDECQ